MGNATTGILIDWLSLSGQSNGVSPRKYKLVTKDYGTSVFKLIQELYFENERICTITSKPHSTIMHNDLMIVKFDNWVLYSDKFYNYFEDVLFETNLVNYKISRIDLAKDFNKFYNNLLPNNLIKKFLASDLLKLGRSKYSVWGETNKFLTYDYLSFGRKSSVINVYLYNKSNEMKQVKFKPHIFKVWETSNLNTQMNVFRLEFSIKQSEIHFINKSTGEEFLFGIDYIFDKEFIEQLYVWLMAKFFRFKINTGQKNISREKDLILFKKSEFDEIVWYEKKVVETNKSDKIFLRKLDTLYSELRHEDKMLFDAIELVREKFANEKHLKDYVKEVLRPETYKKLEHPSYFKPELKRQAMDERD